MDGQNPLSVLKFESDYSRIETPRHVLRSLCEKQFESDYCRIETLQWRTADTSYPSLNRTTVELKLVSAPSGPAGTAAFESDRSSRFMPRGHASFHHKESRFLQRNGYHSLTILQLFRCQRTSSPKLYFKRTNFFTSEKPLAFKRYKYMPLARCAALNCTL